MLDGERARVDVSAHGERAVESVAREMERADCQRSCRHAKARWSQVQAADGVRGEHELIDAQIEGERKGWTTNWWWRWRWLTHLTQDGEAVVFADRPGALQLVVVDLTLTLGWRRRQVEFVDEVDANKRRQVGQRAHVSASHLNTPRCLCRLVVVAVEKWKHQSGQVAHLVRVDAFDSSLLLSSLTCRRRRRRRLVVANTAGI